MSEEEKVNKFELVFQGPIDDSVRTLQRLKGTFISDFEFPIAEVQKILNEAPLTIYSSDSEEEANQKYKTLQRAGAKVLLIQPVSKEKDEEPSQEASNGDEAVFEIEDLTSTKKAEPKPAEPKVYSLDIDDVLFNTLDIQEQAEQILSEGTQPPEKEEAKAPVPDDDAPLFPTLVKPGQPAAEAKNDSLFSSPELDTPPAQFSLDEADLKIDLTASIPVPKLAVPTPPDSLSLLEIEDQPVIPVAGKAAPVTETKESKKMDFDLTLALEEEPKAPKPAAVEKAPEVKQATKPAAAVAPKQNAADHSLDLTLAAKTETPPAPAPKHEAAPQPVPVAEEPKALKAATSAQIPVAPQRSLKESFIKRESSLPVAADGAPASEVTIESDQQTLLDSKGDAEVAAEPAGFKKREVLKEILVPLGVGIIMLGLANWVYWTFIGGPSESEISVGPEMMHGAQSGDDTDAIEASKKSAANTTPPSTFDGTREEAGRKTHALFQILGEGVKAEFVNEQITIELPPLPAPSAKQIVDKTTPPWVYKIEVDALQFNVNPDRTVDGTGPAKYYYEYQENRKRSLALATFSGKLSEDGTSLTGELNVFNEYAAAPTGGDVKAITLANGKIQFALTEQIQVQKVIAKK